MDTSGTRHRGVLTADDMARWTPHVEAPLTYDYGRYTVCKTGPWGQGPVTLQQLALLKGFDLDGLDPTGPDFIHLVVEALEARLCRPRGVLRRSRFRRSADGDAVVGCLQRGAPQADRRQGVARIAPRLDRRFRRGGEAAPRDRRDGGRRRRATVGRLGAGEPTVGKMGAMRGDTVHFDIIDQAGNMISSTPSGGWLHSSPVIPELGFCLGTRAQMFWLEEGHPAALAPGKRPRTTLSPTMALRDGEPYLGLGLAGRRRPGSMDHADVPAPRPLRHESAGIDRRAGLAFRTFPELVLAAHGAPRRAGASKAACRKRPSTNWSAAATSSRSGPDWSEGRLTAASRVGRRRRAAANPRGMQGYAAGR